MAEIPNVRLRLASRADNVLVVRQALNGVASTFGLDPVASNDLNTAVTEACNNVVLHAYGREEGPLEVEVYARREALGVVVRDRGRGVTPHGHAEQEPTAGIGMHVIHALTSSVEFESLNGDGTEVRMEFHAPEAGGLAAQPQASAEAVSPPPSHPHASDDVVAIALTPNRLAQAVLPRVLTVLAARAFFSTDRISDLELLADALVAEVSGEDERLSIAITPAPRDLELRVGPLPAGSAAGIVQARTADSLGSLVERFSDSLAIEPDGRSETLSLRVRDTRGAL